MDQNDIDSDACQRPFRNVFERESLVPGGIRLSALSLSCMHCEDAACVKACPAACLYKDEESGLTLFENSNCTGCRLCAAACPYGIPSFNPEGKMVKCDGCAERLRDGREPACARVCPGGALNYGEYSDAP
jgi:Fe-S-cluster-containing dehydrogenase component